MLVWEVSVQQQDLDEGTGARCVAVGLAGRGPPLVVDWGEPSRLARLLQRGGTWECTGLAQQDLEVVVEVEPDLSLRHQALMTCDHRLAVVNHQLTGVQ